MIRLLLLIAIIASTLYLLRWFLTSPAETVAANIRKTLWLLLGLGLIFLAISGRLNIIFAFIGSAIPFIARQLPNILRILGVAKTVKQASARPDNKPNIKVTNMSSEEALKILGLATGASKSEVLQAHKRLMHKLHPDKGGSTYLASQLNNARDTLLKNDDL
ncbi:MAG: aconitate hydratase [Cycloclasticus sp.]|nr:aconitate hydratase [Cycloclasticus sp.]